MLELRDVILAVGPSGAERVILRGADLRLEDGDAVLLYGLDSEERSSLTALLSGRTAPRYGKVRVSPATRRHGTGLTVLDGGDAPRHEPGAAKLPAVGGPGVLVLLGGPDWSRADLPERYRSLRLDGGQFVEPSGAGQVAEARIPAAELHARVVAELRGAGAGEAAAEASARVLVDAECRGHRSHGVALLPTYLRRIASGGIIATAAPELTQSSPTVAIVDAGGGLGQPAADLAAEWCAATAAKHGLAAVAVRNNNHVGMLAAYRRAFQDHQVVGLVLNTSGPSVAAPGASRPTLGSNAICLITPSTPGEEPFCVDMATGVVAAGKIRDAANRGLRVPDGWLQDASGAVSTDPADLDRGGSVPLFGDYKGLCITLLAEILAGALAGDRVSPDVTKQRRHPDQVMGCSQLFVGFSSGHFPTTDGLPRLVDRLREAVLAGHDAEPSRPWFPDQMEEDSSAEAETRGIGVPVSVMAELGWDAA